jgi:hypothetical protein
MNLSQMYVTITKLSFVYRYLMLVFDIPIYIDNINKSVFEKKM